MDSKELTDIHRLLAKAIDTMQLGFTVTDRNGKILHTNPAEARMHGFHLQDLIGNDARIFAPRELWKPMTLDQMREIRSWRRESTNIREDGTLFPVQILSDVLTDSEGEPIGIVTISEDITERKPAHYSLYDPLTGLPNCALFMDRLNRALKRIKRRQDFKFAVLIMDIDQFKSLNDSFGQVIGDQILGNCARRLENCLRFGDTIARLRADEFAVLLEDIK
ncbi:MAG TPA: diguanylate cyclase, partial [Acidobacteriota bacterium]